MRKLFMLLAGLSFLSCNSQNLILKDPKDMTKNYDLFNKFVDRYEGLKDITERHNYKIYEEDGNFYLSGQGINKNKQPIVFRIKFKGFESNTLTLASEGESCSGVTCEECAFKRGGGCECQRGVGGFGAGSCNHTVTR